MNKRYFIKAAKYFVFLVCLLLVLYTLMFLTGYTTLETFKMLAKSDRGVFMIFVLIGLPLLYPFFGYVSREVSKRGNINGASMERVMELNGFAHCGNEGGAMKYRAVSFYGKLSLFFEDEVTVTETENSFILSGPRKIVVKTEFRLKSLV